VVLPEPAGPLTTISVGVPTPPTLLLDDAPWLAR
jgi:hypothetical protein